MNSKSKRIGPTEYKYVEERKYHRQNQLYFYANVRSINKSRSFYDLRKAAKWVDVQLILAGKQPVNILKPKTII